MRSMLRDLYLFRLLCEIAAILDVSFTDFKVVPLKLPSISQNCSLFLPPVSEKIKSLAVHFFYGGNGGVAKTSFDFFLSVG